MVADWFNSASSLAARVAAGWPLRECAHVRAYRQATFVPTLEAYVRYAAGLGDGTYPSFADSVTQREPLGEPLMQRYYPPNLSGQLSPPLSVARACLLYTSPSPRDS